MSMGQKIQSSTGNGLIWRGSQYFEKNEISDEGRVF